MAEIYYDNLFTGKIKKMDIKDLQLTSIGKDWLFNIETKEMYEFYDGKYTGTFKGSEEEEEQNG